MPIGLLLSVCEKVDLHDISLNPLFELAGSICEGLSIVVLSHDSSYPNTIGIW